MNNVKISPPWFTLWNEFHSCLAGTPGVTVKPLEQTEQPLGIQIEVADSSRATALASVLKSQTPYVSINVFNAGGAPVKPVSPTSAEQLAVMMATALGGGPLYVTTVVQQGTPMSPVSVFPVFAKKVVQFFNDDLTDLYHDYNAVAAAAFTSILNPSPGGFSIHPSTTNTQ